MQRRAHRDSMGRTPSLRNVWSGQESAISILGNGEVAFFTVEKRRCLRGLGRGCGRAQEQGHWAPGV